MSKPLGSAVRSTVQGCPRVSVNNQTGVPLEASIQTHRNAAGGVESIRIYIRCPVDWLANPAAVWLKLDELGGEAIVKLAE